LGDALGNSRFFFQFNPQQIQRSVSVSGGLMNPLLQDPGQFSVATPGNATFSFDIFLNREAEVNAAINTLVTTPIVGSADQLERVGIAYRPNIEQNPGKYGVLSDIQVLDNIIGQGITEKTINALSKIQSISSTWDTSETSAGASVTGAAENAKTAEDIKKALENIQFGNSAFLISTPVRIVFSSMFMIDGFIQGSNVMFSKFSGDMIPTVCAINITVEAKYIGFAREKTYLTESLASAFENPNKDGIAIPESTVGVQAEYDLLRNLIKNTPKDHKYQIVLAGFTGSDKPGTWDGRNEGAPLYEVVSFEDILCRFGFMDDTNPDGTSSDMSKAFYDGKYALEVSHTPEVRVWRTFNNNAERLTAQNSGITRSNSPIGPGKELTGLASGFPEFNAFQQFYSRDVLLVDIKCAEAKATDYSTWRKFHAYGGGAGSKEGSNNSKSDDDVTPQQRQNNTIFESAKVVGQTRDDALRLYLPEDEHEARNNVNPLIVDIKVSIYAKITSMENKTAPSTISFDIYKTFITDAKDRFHKEVLITDKDIPKG
jgi:hypothetical protein